MGQLVKLQERADEFRALDTEVIVVFREERDGIEGLKKTREKTKTTFRLGLDLNKDATAVWSSKQGQFANYVVDRHGIVRGMVDGDLRDRATADELLQILKTVNTDTSSEDSDDQKQSPSR